MAEEMKDGGQDIQVRYSDEELQEFKALGFQFCECEELKNNLHFL